MPRSSLEAKESEDYHTPHARLMESFFGRLEAKR